MSNLPENENKEILQENISNENESETSTVFADPSAHAEYADKKRKKNRLVVGACALLVAAVLGLATFAVTKLIPEKENDYSSPYAQDFVVKEMDSDDLKSITLTNKNGKIEFYSQKNSEDETVWSIKGVDAALLSESGISSFIRSATSISATREITKMSVADCGLDNPTVYFDIVDRFNKTTGVYVGNISADKTGYYLKFSDSDKIYLVSESLVDNLNGDILSYATDENTPAFELPSDAESYKSEQGTMNYFDTLTIKSKKFSDTLVLENKPTESKLLSCRVTSPTKRVAENYDGILAVFQSGLATNGAYSYDVSPKSLKAVGLDNPDFQATVNVKGKTLTYKFTLQADGDYAVVCDNSKLISRVSQDSVASFTQAKLTDFYSAWISLYSIADISEFNVTLNGTKYNISVTANEDEDAKDKYNVTLNGKAMDCKSFQNIYGNFVSLSCTDYMVENITSKPFLQVEIVFKDTSAGKTVIEFAKAGEVRYQYSVDGVNLGKLNASSLNKFIKYFEKFVSGETVEVIK